MSLDPSTQTLGNSLFQRRKAIGADRKTIASGAGISYTYYAAIERGQITAPNSTLSRIFVALGLNPSEIQQLQRLAAQARGLSQDDAGLPDEVSGLIADIRKAAFTMPARFVRHLRTMIREINE